MRDLKCLRCQEPMRYIKSEKLQLGQTGWFLGDLPNLLSGAMEVEIYACPACGKLELYQSTKTAAEKDLPQVKCPKCGKTHDFDYPKCPFCKFQY